MKNKIIITLMLIPFLAMSQSTPANNFFEKHSGQEGYTSIYITKYMFDIFSKVTNELEEKEFSEITSNLNSIKMLTLDSGNEKFEKDVKSVLPKSIYKELMIIKDEGEEITFLINEKNNVISEFVMIINGNAESLLIILDGIINLKQISKLAKTMDVNGFKHLDKVE